MCGYNSKRVSSIGDNLLNNFHLWQNLTNSNYQMEKSLWSSIWWVIHVDVVRCELGYWL